ncbi:MAG: TlpA family protein disulfide reductase, partial [Pedobacter sp.]
DGTFSYTTTAIKTPFTAGLTNRKQIQIQLFIAPGYDLQVNANVKDFKSVKQTLSYQGLGGKTNSYWTTISANYKPEIINWLEKDEDTYINYLKQPNYVVEAISKTFNADNMEPYSAYFKEVLLLDRKFGQYLDILGSYGDKNSYTWVQIEKMIAKLGYKALSEEFKDGKNLSSSVFCYLLGQYPYYCKKYGAFNSDIPGTGMNYYSLLTASKYFKGEVYDFVVSTQLKSRLPSMSKLEEFTRVEPFILKIEDPIVSNEIKKLANVRKQAALILQVGAPSPLFNLADTSGKFHRLEAMKGKVVYIDLWASWCGPCKVETPHLKKIYDHFKNDDKIQFISIASFDAKNRKERYKIIKADKMVWLQLEDTSDSFAKSYFANSIPRFIIIDKQGKIVDNDAVRPSEPAKLMAILKREISK